MHLQTYIKASGINLGNKQWLAQEMTSHQNTECTCMCAGTKRIQNFTVGNGLHHSLNDIHDQSSQSYECIISILL